ncbi:MAG: [FeFe] hydrogenase H-cluster radical SAM maturase HydE [Myxococcota bacterium]
MRTAEILSWLREEDEHRLEQLWSLADETRRRFVGDEVHLRGLVELSNVCARSCAYCGIRAASKIERYRMTEDEVMDCARQAVSLGYGTLVLQAGEDPGLGGEMVSAMVRRIKAETPLAVTLSLGERSLADLREWRRAGADRYLLRFETSNPALYESIHPPLRPGMPGRIEILGTLRELGYEVGSGIMVGIPGQSYADLARDIKLFGELDLEMIGIGPFIAHPETPLGACGEPAADQVPPTDLMTCKAVALARLVCPESNIPSTTALSIVNLDSGREQGLMRGANVVMPNLTPPRYRSLYEIYPAKASLKETAEECGERLRGTLAAMGRRMGTGRGDSPRRLRRSAEESEA